MCRRSGRVSRNLNPCGAIRYCVTSKNHGRARCIQALPPRPRAGAGRPRCLVIRPDQGNTKPAPPSPFGQSVGRGSAGRLQRPRALTLAILPAISPCATLPSSTNVTMMRRAIVPLPQRRRSLRTVQHRRAPDRSPNARLCSTLNKLSRTRVPLEAQMPAARLPPDCGTQRRCRGVCACR